MSSAERRRFRLGSALLVLSFCAPALIPLVTLSDLSGAWKATLAGALAAGVPEVGMLAAVAVMGKAGFQRFKTALGRRLAPLAPAQHVGRARHNVGVVLFALPLVLAWGTPYLGEHLPGHADHPLVYAVAGDVLLLVSLFVLGGDFWDKLRGLFVWKRSAALEPGEQDGTGSGR